MVTRSMGREDALRLAIPLRGVRIDCPSPYPHGLVIPNATYRPWTDDPMFEAVMTVIRPYTLVDEFRCHELWQLVAETASLDGDILEVGVWRGGTGCLMAAKARDLGLPKKVVLCDTFCGVVKAGDKDSYYQGGEHSDTSIEVVKTLAGYLAVHNIEILQGMFPEESAAAIADRRFALCHIDVDVYESARDVLNWVWPRLLTGGVVVFDDYGFSTCDGVTRLVNELRARPGVVTIHNLNGHAVMIKTADIQA